MSEYQRLTELLAETMEERQKAFEQIMMFDEEILDIINQMRQIEATEE